MREFKFRSWQGRTMHYFDFDDVLYKNFDPSGYGIHDEAIMQYTGLSDKDDTEIFEGDILKVWQDMEHVPNRDSGGGIIDFDQEEGWVQLGVVEFHSCSFSYKTVKTLDGKHEEIHLPIDWLTNYGVVGNIYENPELLSNPDIPKT